jgi:predicted nuclease with RNAse H fold
MSSGRGEGFSEMFFIGMDLSGPSNSRETALAAFRDTEKGDLAVRNSLQGADDTEISDFIKGLRPAGEIVVGIDAPLSYNVGGGDRPGDAELRRKISAAGLAASSVMTPTMTRMVYLTLRGIAIARMLPAVNEKARIVEVHPGAAMVLRGAPVEDVAAFKQRMESRRNLLQWLEKQGLREAAAIRDPSDHYVAACACVLAAWKWFQNKSVWLHAAEQPFHPFDFAC